MEFYVLIAYTFSKTLFGSEGRRFESSRIDHIK